VGRLICHLVVAKLLTMCEHLICFCLDRLVDFVVVAELALVVLVVVHVVVDVVEHHHMLCQWLDCSRFFVDDENYHLIHRKCLTSFCDDFAERVDRDVVVELVVDFWLVHPRKCATIVVWLCWRNLMRCSLRTSRKCCLNGRLVVPKIKLKYFKIEMNDKLFLYQP
jgi:hypothetical protein